MLANIVDKVSGGRKVKVIIDDGQGRWENGEKFMPVELSKCYCGDVDSNQIKY